MPAREMFFTFNTGVEINKKNVEEFKKELNDNLNEEDLQNLLTAFEAEEVDKEFFKNFIKELKSFDSVSWETDECSLKKGPIIEFVRDILGGEEREPQGILGIRYLYDEWEYEGCGHEDHYYATYVDKQKVIKKYTKEAQEAVRKLKAIGVDVTFKID